MPEEPSTDDSTMIIHKVIKSSTRQVLTTLYLSSELVAVLPIALLHVMCCEVRPCDEVRSFRKNATG